MIRFPSDVSQEGFGFFEQTFRVFSRLCGGPLLKNDTTIHGAGAGAGAGAWSRSHA